MHLSIQNDAFIHLVQRKKITPVSILENDWITNFYYENIQIYRKLARIVKWKLCTSYLDSKLLLFCHNCFLYVQGCCVCVCVRTYVLHQNSSGKIFYYKGAKNQLASEFSSVNQIAGRKGNNVYSVWRAKGHAPDILCPTECFLMNAETFLCN